MFVVTSSGRVEGYIYGSVSNKIYKTVKNSSNSKINRTFESQILIVIRHEDGVVR